LRSNPTNIPDVSANPIDNDREAWMRPLLEAVVAIPAAVKAAVMKPNGPIVYESFTFELSTTGGQPVMLLGYDLSRVRALVRSSVTDVFIGKMEQLTSGLGYAVTATTTSGGDELRTNDAIYVVWRSDTAAASPALISVWVEKVAD